MATDDNQKTGTDGYAQPSPNFMCAFQEMINVETKFREDMRAFVAMLEQSASAIPDKKDREALYEFLEPYRQLRDTSLYSDITSFDDIDSAIGKIHRAFGGGSLSLQKNKVALSRCITEKKAFQQLLTKLLGKKSLLDAFTPSSFKAQLAKRFAAAKNSKNLKTKSTIKENDLMENWVNAALVFPVQTATRYGMVLSEMSKQAEAQKTAGKPLAFESKLSESAKDAKDLGLYINEAMRASENLQIAKAAIVLPTPPVVATKAVEKVAMTAPERKAPPTPILEKSTSQKSERSSKRRHSSSSDSSSHSSQKSTSSSLFKKSVDTNKTEKKTTAPKTKVDILREIIDRMFPDKTNIKFIEKLRIILAMPNENTFAAIQELAKKELREHVPSLLGNSQNYNPEVRQLIRHIAAGNQERLQAQLARLMNLPEVKDSKAGIK